MQVEVSKLIDEGRWTFYQKFLIACTALTIILDGIDNQILGLTVKAMAGEWKLEQKDFATALMMSPFGMMIGGAIGGWLGDRIGRRNALRGSVIAFALPTAAVFFAPDRLTLCILRFLAGLGLGGAMPTATALSSEYVPKRYRPLAVTLTIVCVPAGSMLASIVYGHLPPGFGWRNMFLVGGIIPVAIGLILFAVLPESPRFLAGRPKRWTELATLLRRFGIHVSSGSSFVTDAPADLGPSRGSIVALFRRDYLGDTLALFSSFFFCLLVNYLAFMVLPGTLAKFGKFEPLDVGWAMFWWNVGGIAGALSGGYVVHHRGSRFPMLTISAAAVVFAFATAAAPFNIENKLTLMVMFVLLGGTINAAQTTMYALAAHVYPTEIRGTGIGSAIAVGRIGNMLAPYVGYFALDHGGTHSYFAAFGVGMILVVVSLTLVRRHIERAAIKNVQLEVGAKLEL